MKGIIVLDEVPKNCSKCMFNTGLNVCKIMKCIKAEKTVSIYTTDKQVLEKTKPDWCPIRSLEEIKNYKNYTLLVDEHFRVGWNSCIDAITGEK